MKALRYLERYFERILITASLCAISLILILQVFMRYFLRAPFVWSEELARYLLVWTAMLGVSLAVREGRHIKVDLLPTIMGPRAGRVFDFCAHFGVLIFCMLMIWFGVPLIERLAKIGQLSPALDIPMWMIYLSVPVGFGMAGIRALQAMYLDIVHPRDEPSGRA